MPRVGLRVAVVLFLLCASRAEAAPRAEVMDLLPKAASRTAQASGSLGPENTLVPLDPALIDALRWTAPETARAACLDAAPQVAEHISRTKQVSLPANPTGYFTVLIDQANMQMQALDLQESLDSLRDARLMLACAGDILTPEQVRRLFLYEAVTHVYAEDGEALPAFLDLLGADSRIFLEPGYPHKVENVFGEAVSRHTRRQPRPIDATGVEGELFVDGRAVAFVRDLLPGRHVVQAGGPARAGGGREVRSALVSVAPGKEPLRLASLMEIRLPTSGLVRDELVRGLISSRLDGFQTAGLEAYLTRKGLTHLAFAVKPPGGEIAIRDYRAGSGLEAGQGGTISTKVERGNPESAASTPADARQAAAETVKSPAASSSSPKSPPAVSASSSKSPPAVSSSSPKSLPAVSSSSPKSPPATSSSSPKSPPAVSSSSPSDKANPPSGSASPSEKAEPPVASASAGSDKSKTAASPSSSPTEAGSGSTKTVTLELGPSVRTAPTAPARRIAVHLGFGFQDLLGSGQTFAATGQGLGYALEIEVPAGPLALMLHAAGFPLKMGEGCSPAVSGSSAADQAVAAASCLSSSGPLSLGLGAGFPIDLSGRLRFLPGLFIDALYIPNVLIDDPGLVGGIGVADMLAAGPIARARLDYALVQKRIAIDIGLELSGGVAVAKAGDQTILTLPVGASVGVGVGF